jgi:hypothetical protein
MNTKTYRSLLHESTEEHQTNWNVFNLFYIRLPCTRKRLEVSMSLPTTTLERYLGVGQVFFLVDPKQHKQARALFASQKETNSSIEQILPLLEEASAQRLLEFI